MKYSNISSLKRKYLNFSASHNACEEAEWLKVDRSHQAPILIPVNSTFDNQDIFKGYNTSNFLNIFYRDGFSQNIGFLGNVMKTSREFTWHWLFVQL